MTVRMTEDEKESVNELGTTIGKWANERNLTVAEILGRLELVRFEILFSNFGSDECFDDDDEENRT